MKENNKMSETTRQTSPAKLFVVPKPGPVLTLEELTQIALDDEIAFARAQFAWALNAARILFRRYRDLVEAPYMPPELIAAFEATFGHTPTENDGYDDESILDLEKFRRDNLEDAKEIASEWLQDGTAESIAAEMTESIGKAAS